MDLQLEFAIKGDLEAWRARTVEAYLKALKESVVEEGQAFQGVLRGEVLSAGLGQGIANAWRLDINPRGSRLAYEPSVYLHSNAAHIIDNFTKGEPYGPRHAQALAIPIPGSPADELRVRRGGKRTDAAEAKFGPLKVIRAKSGVLMLVGFGKDNGKGGFRGLTRRRHKASGGLFTPVGQALVMIPLFWLVYSARLAKRLDWPQLAEAEQPKFAGRVAGRLRSRIEESRRAGQVEG